MKTSLIAVLVSASLLLPAATFAAPSAPAAPVVRVSPNCSAGTVYDDGSFEGAYTLAEEPVVDMVTLFDLPADRKQLDQVCLCWTRTTPGSTPFTFDLVVYGTDGPGGTPGTLLTGLGGIQTTNVPLSPNGAFTSVNLSSLGIKLPAERIFVGASWDGVTYPDVALCGDRTGSVPRPTYASTDQGDSWVPTATFFPELAALGIRAEFSAGDGPGFTCVPNATTLCLRNGRFQARLSWVGRNEGGEAQVVPGGSNSSGLFYFKRQDNWEMLLKVLDGCALNGNYWVFFAAVTDVEYTLTVVDSDTGATKVYRNALGVSSPAVTDNQAFPTCP